MKDYYKILEINYGCAPTEIKKAYRRLALKYHPDKNRAAEAAKKFIEITEAYEVLRDPVKKSNYDIHYERYFVKQRNLDVRETLHEKQQKDWREYGEQKAREYSEMKFEDFSARLFEEIKIGTHYLPNLITISLVAFGGIGMLLVLPQAFEKENGGMGFFLLLLAIGMGFLIYHLYKVMSADYREERKRNFK